MKLQKHKTLVIGHTSGIGKEIYDSIPNRIGVSKSTGFDISTDISKKWDYSEYSCIILNAVGLESFSQIKTMFNIVENKTWDKKNLLIVMSSISAEKCRLDTIDKIKYSVEKNAINKASRMLNELGYSVSVVCPSYVDTEWNKNRNDVKKLSKNSVSYGTINIINEYFDNGVLISEITLQKI